MTIKHRIRKFFTNPASKKKAIFIGSIAIIGAFALVFVMKTVTTDMSASVLNIKTTQDSRIANLDNMMKTLMEKPNTTASSTSTPVNKTITATKSGKAIQLNPTPISLDSCTDSDGGKTYGTKGTITTVINGYTRVEQDSCNSDGTLREWFCGNPGDAAGLLRSENYVDCGAGYSCQNGACIQQTQSQGTGDVIIENMYMLPNDTPMMLSNNYDNQIYLVIKNIGNGTINVPINTTYSNTNRFSLKCSGTRGMNYFVTSALQGQILPNESVTAQLYVGQWSNDFYGRYSTPGTKSITCTIMSHPNPINTPPDPNNPADLYESDRTNNSFTLPYTVQDIPLPDVIIENAYITPNNTPQQWSDNSTNQIFLKIKNIGSGDLIIPQLLGIPKFGLGFRTDKGNGGGVMHLPISDTILHINQSTTIQLIRTGQDSAALYTDSGAHWIEFSIASQQEQGWQSPDINDTGTIFESDGTNNTFKLNYNVIPSQNLVGDIVIEEMHIQNNPATVGSNTVNNKVYITLKNIGNGDIIIPYSSYYGDNPGNRFDIGCEGNGTFSVKTEGVGQSILGPNQTITTELVGEPYNTAWYGTIGNKSITCSVESQQQQGWQTPDPANTGIIYESNGSNNTFTLPYQVVPAK